MRPVKTCVQVFRWMARVVGALILAFVSLHVAVEGPPDVVNISPREWLLWGGFGGSLVGFALLWKWELAGGITALSGMTLFYSMNYALSGKFPGGWIFPLFFLPGFLSIACCLVERITTPKG